MILARFQHLIEWWQTNGKLDIEHLESVLKAKKKNNNKPAKFRHLSIRTVNANK